MLPSLRQPNTLAELPQHWFQGPGWNNPYIRPPLLPRELILMRRTGFAWDLAPPREGWPQEGRLRLQFESLPPGFQAQVRLNGIVLEPSEDVSEPFPNPYPPLLGTPDQLRAWRVPGKLLKDGINMIDITQKEGANTRLTFLDLALK